MLKKRCGEETKEICHEGELTKFMSRLTAHGWDVDKPEGILILKMMTPESIRRADLFS